jgi:hypothetical protein
VGNFLVVVPSTDSGADANRLFKAGLEVAREIRSQTPSKTVESDWALAASFTRQNGSGGTLVTDPATGSWLLSSGTWFHNEGYASGSEFRLLQRYLETNALQLGRELEGFFVLVIGDARTREVVVVADIIGSCHCFRRTLKEGIALSGSSLLLASLSDYKLDSVACQEFLASGIIYENRTFYEGIQKLTAASVVRIQKGAEAPAEIYWDASKLKLESLRGKEAVDALWEKTTRAAKRVESLYSNSICDLTGGYDSRILVAGFVGAGVRCATAVSGPADSHDVIISRGLAKMLGLPHLHNPPLERISFEQLEGPLPLTDGECNLVEYAAICENHRKLSQQFDISINGSFGEVARGYWWELLFPRIGARGTLDARKLAARRYAAQGWDPSMIPAKNRIELVDHFTGIINRANAGLSNFPNTFQMDHAYLRMRMQHWQGRIASSTNQIWPCLSPFMFRSVLEPMLETRALLRWRSLLVRKMLAKFSPRMAAYPLEHGFPAEPTTWRNFYRFTPLGVYFAEKVVRKVKGKLGERKAATSTGSRLTPRLQLWNDERVVEVLRPAHMKLNAWMDVNALEDFLGRSQGASFAFGDQWARLLSLECTLRSVERGRQAAGL